MAVQDLITDAAIDIVFENTNFGGQSPREVIEDTLYSIKAGYQCGRTATCCCLELGLISNPKPRHYELTLLGEAYLRVLQKKGSCNIQTLNTSLAQKQ